MEASDHSAASAPQPKAAVVVKDEDVATLAGMGFDPLLAHAALLEAKGSLQRALQILL